MELFAEIVDGCQALTISLKSFIIDVWQGSSYASDMSEIN